MSVHIIDHPLVQHKLSLMRDKNASTNKFRQLLQEISMLIGYEVTRDFPLIYEEIETPLQTMSACDAIDRLKKDGFHHIRLMCLVASPQGVKAVRDNHPDVDIYLAALDEGLNERNYILPGLGDAGDRIFGTK